MRSVYSWLPPHAHVTVSRPHMVGVSFTAHRGVLREYAGHTEVLDIPAGAVFANGRDLVTWGEVREPNEVVEIYPELSLLRRAADTSQATEVEIEPAARWRDPVVLAVAAVLKRAHAAGAYVSATHASTLAHLLAEHVVAQYCGVRPARSRQPRRLDRALLDRVDSLVDERLGDPLPLDELATAAGLSPFHFARVFKATTGLPPHAYVTMRRLERAQALLLGSRRSVPAIAHAVGFSNVSHFRRVFRRHTGVLPSDLRAS
jgi:AraC family transcriptional regulator